MRGKRRGKSGAERRDVTRVCGASAGRGRGGSAGQKCDGVSVGVPIKRKGDGAGATAMVVVVAVVVADGVQAKQSSSVEKTSDWRRAETKRPRKKGEVSRKRWLGGRWG